MSLPLSAKAPIRIFPAGIDESRGAARPARGRAEASEPAPAFGLACRDVLDEVRHRMAVRGFRWE
jgi:hypothetical protein